MKTKRKDKPPLLQWFESEMQRLMEETNGCDAAYIFGHPKAEWREDGELLKIEPFELAMRRPPAQWFFEFGRTVYPGIIHPKQLPEFRHRFSFFQAYADAIAEAWQKYTENIEQEDKAFRAFCHATVKQLPDANQKLETWIKVSHYGSE